MIASLLPGLRELRAPLATGYLWLASCWLIFGDHLAGAGGRTGDLVSDVGDLSDRLGSGATLAALTFAAYLLGCTVGVPRPPARWDTAVRPAFEDQVREWHHDRPQFPIYTRHRWLLILQGWIRPPQRSVWESRTVAGQIAAKIEATQGSGISVEEIIASGKLPNHVVRWVSLMEPNPESDTGDYWSEINRRRLTDALLDVIDSEMPALANKLQIERESIFDRYDRLRAEGEFRISAALPLAALVAATSARVAQPILLVALLLPVSVFIQGWKRHHEAESVLWESLAQGLISSPTLDAVTNLWREVPEPPSSSLEPS